MSDSAARCPTYPIDTILSLAANLRAVLQVEFAGQLMVGVDFHHFVQRCLDHLPVAHPDLEALIESLTDIVGQRLDEDKLRVVTARLAGNLDGLRAGRTAPPWAAQRSLEWAPLRLDAVRGQRNRAGEPGVEIECTVLAGPACPLKSRRWWSLRMCRYAARFFGFSRRASSRARHPAKYPYTDPRQLVGLRFYGLLDPALSRNQPGFHEIRFPGSVQEHNRRLLKMRFRVDPGYDCPEGFSRLQPCHACPIGYTRCAAATHRDDWISSWCDNCGKDSYRLASHPEACLACGKASIPVDRFG